MTDKELTSILVIDFGYSRRNSEIVVEMIYDDLLNNEEKEVINFIKGKSGDVYLNKHLAVVNHLNFRITQNGGEPRTKASKVR
jgi:hypothetical protein